MLVECTVERFRSAVVVVVDDKTNLDAIERVDEKSAFDRGVLLIETKGNKGVAASILQFLVDLFGDGGLGFDCFEHLRLELQPLQCPVAREQGEFEGSAEPVEVRVDRHLLRVENGFESALAGGDGADDLPNEVGAGAEVVDQRERTDTESCSQAPKCECRQRLVNQVVNYLLQQGGFLIGVSFAGHFANITYNSYNNCFLKQTLGRTVITCNDCVNAMREALGLTGSWPHVGFLRGNEFRRTRGPALFPFGLEGAPSCLLDACKTGRGPDQMTGTQIRRGRIASIGAGILATAVLLILPAGTADAASVLNGPINLGTAASYGVLAGSAVTNTGTTVVTGDLGVSPQSSITGFGGAPAGSVVGTVNDDNAAAGLAKNDLTTAFNNAAGLTPTSSGLTELSGKSLAPGVYSGGALNLADNGTLTLAGTSANSIWVFQAASTLTIGSATHILISGGANECNVFWEVGSSATIGTTAQFQGTVMASASITANTGAQVLGRLLASTAAVTLHANTITVSPLCPVGSAPGTSNSPAITSGSPTGASVGTPYSFPVTASGTPTPTFAVGSGTLPPGLVLNPTTGVISGTAFSEGTSTFTIIVSNGTAPNVTATYNLTVSAVAKPLLATTGVDPTGPLGVGTALLVAGALLMFTRRGRAARY